MPEKHPSPFPGIRYYEHPTRKHRRRPDRYLSIRYRKNGERVEEGVGWTSEGWTAEEANRILGDIKQNIKRGTGPQSLKEFALAKQRTTNAPESMSFAILANHYLKWAKRNKKSWKEDNYLLNKRILPLFGKRQALDITRTDIEKFRDALTDDAVLSPMTIKHHLIVIRRIFNWASNTPLPNDPERMLFEGRNPMNGVRIPLIDNERVRFLTREEADRLLEAATGELHDIILLALLTGMRRQEVLGLAWQDVDMINRVITIPAELTRSKRSRKAFLDDELHDMLQRRRSHTQSPYVFPGSVNGHRDEDHTTRQFNALVTGLGLNNNVTDQRHKVLFHTLRHTFASWLAQEGVDIPHLMELTGHKTVSMVQRYAHLMPERTRALASLISRHARPGQSNESLDQSKT